MAQHYGSYFYLKHSDKGEIDRLKTSIQNKTEIAEICDIQSKTICVEDVQVLEHDDNDPNRIVLKLEFRRDLPVALFETLEGSGFQVLAHVYDLSGGAAWMYANKEFIRIPNWLDSSQLARAAAS